MTKTDIAKQLASFVVGGCTAKVVKEIVVRNTDPESVADKAVVFVASCVIGAMARDATKVWTDAKIDKLIAWWIENVTDQRPK